MSLGRPIIAALVLVCAGDRSFAADQASGDVHLPITSSLPDFLQSVTDFGGVRSTLEKAGLKFTFTYFGDAFGNPEGGVKQGLGYDGRFGTIIDGDLEKLVGWSGVSFHASIHQIHGTQFSAQNLDNLMTVSGIEAPPSTRLFNLWLAEDISKQINLRVGQFSAAQEFLVSQTANLFVNSTFGWPALTAQDLPSGGPAYPEATPGARVQFTPNSNVTVLAAAFNGDPAGPGPGNPVQRDPFGLAFRVTDSPFLIAEIDYTYGQAHPGRNSNQEGSMLASSPLSAGAAELPGTIKIGAWLHTGMFADQQFSSDGEPLAASGSLLQHWGNYAVYGVLDQIVWRAPGNTNRALNIFVRAMAAPADRNLIDLYADGGLSLNGPIDSRPNDTVGLAIAYGRISPDASAYDREIDLLTGRPLPDRDFEAALELTYQWFLRDGWYIQPNLQYIIHPGGNIPSPAAPDTTSPIPNALVLGTRLVAHF